MCLAVPGKVLSIDRNSTPFMGIVDFAGVKKQVCMELIPEVREGEYVVVHVGFALNTVDEQDALETLNMLREIGELDKDTGN